MNRAAAVYSGGFSLSINPRPCHSEPVTDVTGVGIRNLLAGNLRKSAGIMRFGNGLPRQSVPQGHLLRGADWLAMTGFCLSGELPWADKSSAPTMRDMSRTKRDVGDAVPYGRFAAPVRRTGFAHPAARKRKMRDGSLCGFHNN